MRTYNDVKPNKDEWSTPSVLLGLDIGLVVLRLCLVREMKIFDVTSDVLDVARDFRILIKKLIT